MELHNLKPAEGSTKNKKRIGRGQGSGRGGTSTKGHKGAKSRSGYKSKLGFEGGQMPIQRRLPKFGFKNINRVEYAPVNLKDLQRLLDKGLGEEITFEMLVENGIVTKNDRVKVLANGEINAKVKVHAHKYSNAAKEAIEAKGGEIVTL